jgi:2-dehydro-3-deoxygluconokinase
MNTVFCFGELLLRLSPQLNGDWIKQNAMPVYIGGAELNVATALAAWDIPVNYLTALPDNYLSKEICTALNKIKINTDTVIFSGNRIGTYYLALGAELKNSSVIYDRAFSSFSQLQTGQIDWEKILKNKAWFHFSAISPGLNENIAAVCKEGLAAAKKMGLTISVDLNYRDKLWQYGKSPKDIMPDLIQYCDVIMGNIWAGESLLGIGSTIKDSTDKSQHELIGAAGESMLQLHQQYPTASTIAYTFRLQNEYFGVLQQGKERAISQNFLIENVIDKAGSGDCFMAGLIYGMLHNHPTQQIINFAASAAVGKLFEKGDSTKQTIKQVNERLQ